MSEAVTLAVYDLSNGMARVMSPQILGEQIEGIWHTGIRVFGKEWFFGGGIQVLPVGVFEQTNGLQVSRIDAMGTTTKTEAQLQAHLGTLSGRFSAATYNLLTNNCNNFSDELCKFLCGHGISPDVIELPNRVFSTPGGMMLRPVIEGMVNNINGTSVQTMDPFGGGNTAQRAGFGAGGYVGAAATTGGYGAASSSSAASSTNGNTSTMIRGTEVVQAGHVVPAELEEAPLVSAQIQGYEGMVARLKGLLEKEENADIALAGVDSVQARVGLVGEIGAALAANSETRASTNPFKLEQYVLLYSIITALPSGQSAALFLLRLMTPFREEELPESLGTAVISPLLGMVTQATASASFPGPFKNVSSLVFALITLSNWCSEDRSAVYASGGVSEETLLDCSMAFLQCERAEVRQIASALAYNLVLPHTPPRGLRNTGSNGHPISLEQWITPSGGDLEVHPYAVQVICGTMEALSEEKDVLVQRRRMSATLRLIRTALSLHASASASSSFSSSFSSSSSSSSGASASASASASSKPINAVSAMILDLGFDAMIEIVTVEAAAQSRTGGREDRGGVASIGREMLSSLRPVAVAAASTRPTVTATPL